MSAGNGEYSKLSSLNKRTLRNSAIVITDTSDTIEAHDIDVSTEGILKGNQLAKLNTLGTAPTTPGSSLHSPKIRSRGVPYLSKVYKPMPVNDLTKTVVIPRSTNISPSRKFGVP